MDVKGALSLSEIVTGLRLYNLRNRLWFMVDTIATTGKGIKEGFEWCSRMLTRIENREIDFSGKKFNNIKN